MTAIHYLKILPKKIIDLLLEAYEFFGKLSKSTKAATMIEFETTNFQRCR